jgi:hypothetical protein
MPVMHEQVHQRTCEQKEPWQRPEDMGAVLGNKEKSANSEEADQDNPGSRGKKAPLRPVPIAEIVTRNHDVLLFNEAPAKQAHSGQPG